MVNKAVGYLFPGWKHLLCIRQGPLVADKWTSHSPWIQSSYYKPSHFLIFLHGAFAPEWNELIQRFNLWPLFLSKWLPNWVIWMIKIWQFSSAPSSSPSQSLLRKPNCHETQYCLEIQVTSTKDGGTKPPPPHALQSPVVEDMIWNGKSSLTEAMVTGPGQAILFYGSCSLG